MSGSGFQHFVWLVTAVCLREVIKVEKIVWKIPPFENRTCLKPSPPPFPHFFFTLMTFPTEHELCSQMSKCVCTPVVTLATVGNIVNIKCSSCSVEYPERNDKYHHPKRQGRRQSSWNSIIFIKSQMYYNVKCKVDWLLLSVHWLVWRTIPVRKDGLYCCDRELPAGTVLWCWAGQTGGLHYQGTVGYKGVICIS